MKKHTIIFLSIVFATDVFSQSSGSILFSETAIHEFRFYFDEEDYWNDLLNTHHTEFYVKAGLNIDDYHLNDVGVRLKGQSSWHIPSNKKSIKIDLDEYEDQKFDGFDKLNLNNCFGDPTLLREKLFYDACKLAKLPAPRANFAKVYLNDVYWGLYTLVEEVDIEFLKSNYGNGNGNLYKGDPMGDLAYYGNYASAYSNKYQFQSGEENNAFSDLIQLIESINFSDNEVFETEVFKKLDAVTFFKYWAMVNLFANTDSYLASGHNFYLYNKPETDKFYFIPWDCNESFGNFNFQGSNPFENSILPLDYVPLEPEHRPLTKRCTELSIIKNYYYTEVYHYLQDFFTEEMLFSKIDTLAEFIKSDVYEDSQKMYSNEEFDLNLSENILGSIEIGGIRIPGLKQFVSERIAYLNAYFSDIAFVPTEYVPVIHESIYQIFIPSFIDKNEALQIEIQEKIYFQLYNLSGTCVYAQIVQPNKNISLSELNNGLYIYHLSLDDGTNSNGKIYLY